MCVNDNLTFLEYNGCGCASGIYSYGACVEVGDNQYVQYQEAVDCAEYSYPNEYLDGCICESNLIW